MDADVRKELQGRWVKAQADVDQLRQKAILVAEKVYAHPREALAAMMGYAQDTNDAALVAKLEKDPEKFGALKGTFRSGDSFTAKGRADKPVAIEQAKILPDLIKRTLQADEEVYALESALGKSGRADGMSKAKGGIDFT